MKESINKIKLDQFFTNPTIVKKTFRYLSEFMKINSKTIFIEPSAGDGKFIDEIRNQFPNKILSYDIEPQHINIIKADFLRTNIDFNLNNLVIGNPPFGYKSKLAIDFINKSALSSDLICFILPIQFRRWSVQNKVDKNLKLIFSSNNLPKNSFLSNGKQYNINCLVQIWVNVNNSKFKKFKDLRIKKAPKNKHEDFKLFIHNNTIQTLKYFDKEVYQWDFAVQRQGFYDYSKRITNSKLLIKNRQYLFIKIINPEAEKIFDKLDFVKLSEVNTIIKGFSNTDLIAKYDELKINF